MWALVATTACGIDEPTFLGPVDAGHDVPDIDSPPGVIALQVTPTPVAVTEGAMTSFTVRLSAAPPQAVRVDLAELDPDDKIGASPTSLTFTPGNFDQAQPIEIIGRSDGDTDNEAVQVRLTPDASADPVTVDVNVTDDDQLGISVTPTTISVTENLTTQVSVVLTAQPPGPVTVTATSGNTSAVTLGGSTVMFSTSNWDVPQVVDLAGVDDLDAVDATATVTFASPPLADVPVMVTVRDDDRLIIVPSTTNLGALTEGDAATFTVRLSQQPTASVVVNLMSSDVAVATVVQASRTFTTTDWMTPQTVNVTLPQDIDTANGVATIALTATGLDPASVALAVIDDDQQVIVAEPTSITVEEGMQRAFGVRLAFKPETDIMVTVRSLDTSIVTVTPAVLTFRPDNYATAQMVTAAGEQDVDAAPELSGLRLESVAANLTLDVPVSVTDDEQLTVVTSAPTITLSESGTAMFGVHMSAQPPSTITVTVSSLDATIATAGPAQLTFSTVDWADDKMVMVSGVQDDDLADDTVDIRLDPFGLQPKVVAATVTDDDMQVVVATPGTATVNELGSVDVGISLRYRPTGPVTVNLATSDSTAATVTPSSLMFDAANYATPKPITIHGVDDIDTVDDTATITASATGATAAPIAVTVTDTDVPGIELSTTLITVPEAGPAGSVGVRLTTPPTGSVTINLATSAPGIVTLGAASVSFSAADWNTYKPVSLTAVPDLNAVDGTVQIIATGPVPYTERRATITIADDEVQGIVLSGNVTLSEAGNTRFQVSLAAQPLADVMVTIASSDTSAALVGPTTLTFTTANYAMTQDVTVTGVADNDLVNESVTVTATAAGPLTASITAAVTDDDTQVVVVAPATTAGTPLTMTEGTTRQFQVSLQYVPSAPTTVTITTSNINEAAPRTSSLSFDAGNYAVPVTVQLDAPQDDDAGNNGCVITASAPAATSGLLHVAITDDDSLLFDLNPNAVTVTEGGATASFGVRLTARPLTPLAITLASSDTTAATVNPTTFTFNSTNWNTFQSFAVAGINDADAVPESPMPRISIDGGGLPTGTVNVTVTEDDVQDIIVAPLGPVTISETGTATINVHLAAQPTTDVVVTVASSDAAVASSNRASLTFTSVNYAADQQVTITAVDDADLANEFADINFANAAIGTRTVRANVTDNDVQSIVVVAAPPASITEGASASFTVRLAFDPGGPVTVTAASLQPTVATVTPPSNSLAFDSTNYMVAKTVNVATLPDVDLAAGSATIRLTQGATTRDVPLAIADDDVQAITLSTPTVTLGETGTATFTAQLAFQPPSNVVVTVASDATGVATVSIPPITFTTTDWAMPRTITVTGVHDVNTGSDTARINLTSSAPALSAQVTATVTDVDVQALVLTPTSLSLTEGNTATFTVRLAFAPSAAQTVSFSSRDTAVATVSPSSYTFTVADYSTPKTVTITAVQDGNLAAGSTTIDVTGAPIPAGTVAVSVTDDDVQTIDVVTAPPNPVLEGQTSSFSVKLGFDPGGPVSVAVSSLTPAVVGVNGTPPVTLAFDSSNYTTAKSVSFTALPDVDLVAGAGTVRLTLGGVTKDVAISVMDDDTQVLQLSTGAVTLSETGTGTFTVRLGFQPTANTTVTLSSTNTAAATVLPASIVFTSADYSTPRTVTVTGVHDVNLDTNSATISLASSAPVLTGTVTASVTDVDVQALVISTTGVTLAEGGSTSFNVRLAFAPTGSQMVQIASRDVAIATVDTAVMTFTAANYNVAQSVILTAPHDLNLGNNSTLIEVMSAPLLTTFSVSVNDDDVQALVVSPSSLVVNEVGTKTFTYNLAFQPTTNTTVSLSTTNGNVAGLSETSFVFTSLNWSLTPRTVTVTSIADADTLHNTATVTVASAGLTSTTVSVQQEDRNLLPIFDNFEDCIASFEFSVQLVAPPLGTENVTINPSGAWSASPSTISFDAADWNSPVLVSVARTSGTINTTTVNVTASGQDSRSFVYTKLPLSNPLCCTTCRVPEFPF